MICMAAVPEPPVMDVGLKATFTPVGCPDAVRAIVPVKPPEGVAVILTLPCPPGATLPFLGVAARVKLPPPELVTVSVTVVVSVVPPEVPFTVMGYTPVAVVPATAIVMVEVPVPVIEVGLKVTVTPVGWPVADNVTGELKPPVVVLVMVEVPDLPCTTDTEVGLAERLKPLVPPEMVMLAAAEGMPFAITNNELAPVSIPAGTSKFVDTIALPVATAIVLCPWVLAKKTCPVPVFTICTSG